MRSRDRYRTTVGWTKKRVREPNCARGEDGWFEIGCLIAVMPSIIIISVHRIREQQVYINSLIYGSYNFFRSH